MELAIDIGDIEGIERIMDDPNYQDTLKKYMERVGNENVYQDKFV